MSPARAHRRSAAGFTLLELMIVIGIIGMVSALAIGGLRTLARTELRGSAARLASAIRYLFDRASTTGKIHRLVFDFENGKYWAEVSDDRFFFPRDRETEETRQKETEEIAKEQEEEAERRKAQDEANEGQAPGSAYDFSRYQAPVDWKPKRARFDLFQEKAWKTTQLKGAKLAGLFTPRYAQPISTGKGYLYFFPLGQTEPAIVHISDEEREIFYSLLVHPLNGRVKVHSGYVEPRVDQQFDDEGKEIEEEK